MEPTQKQKKILIINAIRMWDKRKGSLTHIFSEMMESTIDIWESMRNQIGEGYGTSVSDENHHLRKEVKYLKNEIDMLNKNRTVQELGIPAPPEFHEWHNPANLSASQIGIGCGYRLLLVNENRPKSYEYYFEGLWRPGHIGSPFQHILTYRTKEPLPLTWIDIQRVDFERTYKSPRPIDMTMERNNSDGYLDPSIDSLWLGWLMRARNYELQLNQYSK